MRIQVKLGDIELESNEESCQAYSEIKDLEFHSRSKMDIMKFVIFSDFWGPQSNDGSRYKKSFEYVH